MKKLFHFLVNSIKRKFREFFTEENLGNIASQTLLVLMFWGSLWGLCDKDALPPNGYLFNVLLVVVMAHIFGKIMQCIGLPPLIGMIIVGFLLNNRDTITGSPELILNENLTNILRHMSLVIVLIRAGLELDSKKLKKMTKICLRLAFIPCIVETITVALMAHFVLDFPMEWGFLMGFVLAAVSPAVVVPPILNFKKTGLGMDKGIPTLLIASASIDDILSIIGFGLCFKLIFLKDINFVYLLFKILAEPLIGVMTGILIGLILWYVPSADASETQKLCLLILGGLSAEFVFTSSEMRAAGPEACFVAAAVAAYHWQTDKCYHKIQCDLKDLWVIFQAILFGLIGTEVRMSDMKEENIFLAFGCLCVGIIMRFLATISILFGGNYTFKEKIFIGFAWLPKATLQVAIAPIILEMAKHLFKKNGDLITMGRARLVVDVAFISVLLTAPVGAIAINILGPRILNRSSSEETLNTIPKKMSTKV